MRESKYPLLNDPDWLRARYEIDGMSSIALAEVIGVKNAATITQSLRRHGIRVRTKSEGHRSGRIDDGFSIDSSVLTGCLLGDSCLKRHNKLSDDSYPSFQKNNIYYDHVLFVGNILFGDKARDRIAEVDNSGGYKRKSNEPQTIFYLRSLTHVELMPWYKSWYPESNGFQKIIPPDILIDKKVLLHWFLDDGYSYVAKRSEKHNPAVRVRFATQSFNREELDFLSETIRKQTGLRITPQFHQRNGKVKGTGLEMALSESQSPEFFELLGSCPVQSMSYKWKV